MKKPRPPRQKGLKADYRDATPEQVAKALVRSRPAPVRHAHKGER